MTPEELQKIIDQFDQDTLNDQAIFGIYQYGGDYEESCIKANKAGLELFALSLLEAARDVDKTLADKEKNLILLDHAADWVEEDSTTFIHYVEPIAEDQKTRPKTEVTTSFKDQLVPFGCIAVLLLILASALVGIVTMVKWVL